MPIRAIRSKKVAMTKLKYSILFPCFLVFGLLAGCGAVLVNEGSKNEPLTDGLVNPENSQPKVVVAPEQKIIGNFEDGSVHMNPKLYGSTNGAWSTNTYGGNTINEVFVTAGGANGTKMAAHVFGKLVNKGDNTYPAFLLDGKLKPTGYYDASPFKGIQFYYKYPAGDQAPSRRFAISIAPIMPSSAGGTCLDGCYNNFGYDLASKGEWTLVTLPFANLTRQPGWGNTITPPEFTEHLKEILGIEWTHNAGNTAGSYNIDYWVDEVEFF